MPKIKLLGFRHTEGKLDNGNPWENFYLHYELPQGNNMYGHTYAVAKARGLLVRKYMKNNAIVDLNQLVGRQMFLDYGADKDGKSILIDIF